MDKRASADRVSDLFRVTDSTMLSMIELERSIVMGNNVTESVNVIREGKFSNSEGEFFYIFTVFADNVNGWQDGTKKLMDSGAYREGMRKQMTEDIKCAIADYDVKKVYLLDSEMVDIEQVRECYPTVKVTVC